VLRGVRGARPAREDPRLGYCEWCARTAARGVPRRRRLHARVRRRGRLRDGRPRRAPAPTRQWAGGSGRRSSTSGASGRVARARVRPRADGLARRPDRGPRRSTRRSGTTRVDTNSELLEPVALGFDVQPTTSRRRSPRSAAQAVGRGHRAGARARHRGSVRGPGSLARRRSPAADDDLDSRPGTDWLVPRLADVARRSGAARSSTRRTGRRARSGRRCSTTGTTRPTRTRRSSSRSPRTRTSRTARRGSSPSPGGSTSRRAARSTPTFATTVSATTTRHHSTRPRPARMRRTSAMRGSGREGTRA
jgi:hypothetical protein